MTLRSHEPPSVTARPPAAEPMSAAGLGPARRAGPGRARGLGAGPPSLPPACSQTRRNMSVLRAAKQDTPPHPPGGTRRAPPLPPCGRRRGVPAVKPAGRAIESNFELPQFVFVGRGRGNIIYHHLI